MMGRLNRNAVSGVTRRVWWEPVAYSAVLAVAYFSMLLCWDLLRNDGAMFQSIFTTVWGLGFLTTGIALHAIAQTTYRQLSALFSAVLGTTLCLALVVLSFSYAYGANGVCSAAGAYTDCIYYAVSVISAVTGSSDVPSGALALFTAWQAVLGVFVFVLLISQVISFSQEYKRIKRLAHPA